MTMQEAPHWAAKAINAAPQATLAQIVTMPQAGMDLNEAVKTLNRGVTLRTWNDTMGGMAVRAVMTDGEEVTVESGRATVRFYSDGLIEVETLISPETATSLGIPQPIGGWWSEAGTHARKVEAWAQGAHCWDIEAPCGAMYHRAYVLRRLLALASATMSPKLRKKLRAMARGYERARCALKNGGCV